MSARRPRGLPLKARTKGLGQAAKRSQPVASDTYFGAYQRSNSTKDSMCSRPWQPERRTRTGLCICV